MVWSVSAVVVIAVLAGCGGPPPGAPGTVVSPPPGATGPSAGCGGTTQGAVTDAAGTVAVDGAIRRYTITVPPAHVAGTSTPVPLVLDFHGLLEGWAGTHPFATQFSAKAAAEGFVVAYPIGSNDGVYWDVSLQESNPDLRFVDRLVEQLGSTLCIDRSRIYVTGLSYGAFMTSMLMCMRANTFAAAAPVAGMRDVCAATDRKVPFVTFHGTDDPILRYSAFADVPQAVASKYGCQGSPAVTTLDPDPDPATGGPITRTTWDCDAVGSAAESYRIGGGGHSWPGSQFFSWIGPIVGPTAASLDATAVIWSFFEQHQL
jgi:polyhydroxybutyrate depolymerase